VRTVGSDVEITHGGIVAVDPDDLRAMATRVRYDAAAVQVAQQDLLAIPDLVQRNGIGEVSAVWTAANRLERAGTALDEVASASGTMADVFELAELRAQQAMLALSDPRLAQGYQHRIDEILAGNVHLADAEKKLLKEWAKGAYEGFSPPPGAEQPGMDGLAMSTLLALSPALYGLFLATGGAAPRLTVLGQALLQVVGPQRGVAPRGPLASTPGAAVVVDASRSAPPGAAMLRPGDVAVTSARSATPATSAPASLSGAVARVPYGQGPQVRVETYALADGSKRFVAYVDGTRPGQPESEPWDMASNVQAYLEHEESDSYKATVAALKDAGADGSTPVDLVGYSQGGMIADLIAQSGEFDVQSVFTVGSPIEPGLPADVLDVAVRHTDDPVAGLAGGGNPRGLGSPDSLVITRTAAPGHGIDPSMPAHQLDAYQETVRLAEGSGDPRMDVIRDHLAVYDGATLEDSRDYTAERVPGEH
jgi:hypothetical protein